MLRLSGRLQAVKSLALSGQPLQQRRYAPVAIAVAARRGLVFQPLHDLRQADLLGHEHRPAPKIRKAIFSLANAVANTRSCEDLHCKQ